MAEETTTATPAAPEKPLSERMEEFAVKQFEQVAAEESDTETTETTEQTAPQGEQSDADGKTTETQEAKPEEITPEQIADPAFWGRLDKAGWERMEREYPVQTRHVKAAQQAASRIVNEARKTAQTPAEPANGKPTEPSISTELQDAIRRANDLDETVAAKGLKDIVRLTLKEALPEFGLNPDAAKASAIAQTAYASVVAETPEIANLDLKELDAIVDASPALTNILNRAQTLPDDIRTSLTMDVMRQAADSLMTKKKAEQEATAAREANKTAKVKETQRKVNSNASIPSNAVVNSPAAGAPTGKKTVEQFVNEQWEKVAAKA